MYLGPDIYQYLLTFLKPDNTCKECINSRKDIQTYVNYCIVFNFETKLVKCEYHLLFEKFNQFLNRIKYSIENYLDVGFSFHGNKKNKNYFPKLITDYSNKIKFSHFCCNETGFMFYIKKND